MSEAIKSTLFRFASLRAPEQLTDDARDLYVPFTNTLSNFHLAVVPGDPSATRTALESEATTFAPSAWSQATIEASYTTKWDFALWLNRNRNTLTSADVTTAVGALTAGSQDALWDQLIYQIITMADLNVRQSLVIMLVAEHFLSKYQSGPFAGDDEMLRKLANSKVALPKDMFTVSSFFTSTTDQGSQVENTALLDKYMSVAEAKATQAQILKAIKEIKAYEDEYNKGYKNVAKIALADYESQVDSAISTALLGTTTPVTDPFTSATFEIFDSYSPPEYATVLANTMTAQSFVEDQITPTGLGNSSKISEETIYIIESNDLYEYSTFQQVYGELERLSQEAMDLAFSATPTKSDNLFVNGSEVPTCALENKINAANSFYLKPFKKEDSPHKYGLQMVINTASPCVQLNSMSITFDGELGGTTLTKYKAVNHKGVMTIDMTPNSSLLVSASDINVDGELYLNDGTKLAWSGVNMDMTEGVKGTLSPDSLLVGTEANVFIPSGYGIRRLGISDYNRVEQTLCCYVPGEVSHIENVLAREYKERSTRRLRKSDTTTTEKTDYERESSTDTSTSSRFDMNQEVAEVLSSSTDFTKDLNISAGLSAGTPGGAFKIDTSVDYGTSLSTNNSRENSNSQSVAISKEITQKASERIMNKVSSERVKKIIEEFEEQNRHGFDNRLGDEHISGVYRWVDKIYKNRVLNYGKRLQYEFMIPEPASFHITAKMAAANQGLGDRIPKPLDPRTEAFGVLEPIPSANEINASNYKQWAAAFNAEVAPPPPWRQVIGRSYSKSQVSGDGDYSQNKVANEDVALPEGYGIDKVYVSAQCDQVKYGSVTVSVADVTKRFPVPTLSKALFLQDNELTLYDKYTGSVPVSVFFSLVWGGQVNVSIELRRKPEVYAKWQLETFNAIIEAYEERQEEYRNAKAEMDVIKKDFLTSNPKYYRDVEKAVLKKNCISYLTGHVNIGQSHIKGSETKSLRVDLTQEMDDYASMAKFFEQAFEWNIMSYNFYPFFWAGKDNWARLYSYENDDAQFKDFLQAGMARVQVTVRPGFEYVVMHYMATGQIWNGGDVPVIGDDLYMSVSEDIKDQAEYVVAEEWETRIPSTLTIVQAESLTLSTTGLPCYCDNIDSPPTENFGSSSTAFGAKVVVEGYTAPEPDPV